LFAEYWNRREALITVAVEPVLNSCEKHWKIPSVFESEQQSLNILWYVKDRPAESLAVRVKSPRTTLIALMKLHQGMGLRFTNIGAQ